MNRAELRPRPVALTSALASFSPSTSLVSRFQVSKIVSRGCSREEGNEGKRNSCDRIGATGVQNEDKVWFYVFLPFRKSPISIFYLSEASFPFSLRVFILTTIETQKGGTERTCISQFLSCERKKGNEVRVNKMNFLPRIFSYYSFLHLHVSGAVIPQGGRRERSSSIEEN